MSRFILLATLLLASALFTLAAVPGDLVTSLPGVPSSVLKSNHYSGFLPSDDAQTVFLHYWFVESSGNPKTDPVIIWLNGGPGCSSLDGFLSELGPLHFDGNRTSGGVPTLIDNPYAWSTIGSVLFLESPAGVGFSYTNNGSTRTNDEITSQNNYGFLKSFFRAYPEYSTNDFYITGESYAGIYIPTFAQRIYEGAQRGDNTINFKGFAVGNGCWGNGVGICAYYDNQWEGVGIELEFLHGHAMISAPHWTAVQTACGNISTITNPNRACTTAIDTALDDGGDYNIYNIYDTCPDPINQYGERAPSVILRRRERAARRHTRVQAPQVPDQCIGAEFGQNWLDNPDVQRALHVTQAGVTNWRVCGGPQYTKTAMDVRGVYANLIKNYKVMIYSGDVDACVPHVGSEMWTRELGFTVADPWKPWLVNNQVAGYVTTYSTNNFKFVTVKGSGHMVPQYTPAPALEMLKRFIAGTF